MSHEPHDHVYRLIRSMTRPEKRYFKLYASRHMVGGKSTYIALFDVIAGMERYEEAALREHFAGASFLRRFTVTKHRLYDTILSSLEAYHADSSVDARLGRQLHRVEILYQRGLYNDAEKALRSARALGEQHGKVPMLLELCDWERRLMERMNYEGVEDSDLQGLTDRNCRMLAELERMERLWRLKSRSFMLLYRQGRARNDHDETELRALLQHPLLRDAAESDPPKVKFLQHHIRSAAAFSLNDMALCEHHLTSNDRLLQEEPAHFQDEPNLPLSVLSNLAYVRLRSGRYTEALEDLKRFKRIPAMMPVAPSPDLEMKVFAMGTSLELALLCRTGDFEKAVGKLRAMEEGFERFNTQLSPIRKAGIRFQAAWACFGAGRYEAAARWCQILLNERGIEAHAELHAMGRLLHLLVLLESGKTDLLRYAVRNVDRFLRSHQRHHRFENALLGHIKARMRAKGKKAHDEAYASLVEEMSDLERDPREQAVFDHLDPLCYALAKLSGRTMTEVAHERAHSGRAAPIPPPVRRKAA